MLVVLVVYEYESTACLGSISTQPSLSSHITSILAMNISLTSVKRVQKSYPENNLSFFL